MSERVAVNSPCFLDTTPLKSNGKLNPINDVEHLKLIAQQHGNCLTNFDISWDAIISVQSGEAHFYHWQGIQDVLIMLQHFSSLGWLIREAYAKNAKPLTTQTRNEIAEALSAFPEICPVWPDRSLTPSFGCHFE